LFPLKIRLFVLFDYNKVVQTENTVIVKNKPEDYEVVDKKRRRDYGIL
jgi:hypothetical protein